MAMFDPEAELQYHIRMKRGDVGRYVILTADPFQTDSVASQFAGAKLMAHNREHKTWTGILDGARVSVTSTGMGCASTAICLEELIKIGADTFICAGNAEPIGETAKPPDVEGVICTSAVRDEGTTLHYVPEGYPAVADRHVTDALAKAAGQMGFNYIEGITQSVDSFYGETSPETSPLGDMLKIRRKAWEMGNVRAFETQAAALLVISCVRGCRASAVFSFKEDIENSIITALEALRLLIMRDGRNDASR